MGLSNLLPHTRGCALNNSKAFSLRDIKLLALKGVRMPNIDLLVALSGRVIRRLTLPLIRG
eukprot:7181150-Pyramimonas_sp.AAC.1